MCRQRHQQQLLLRLDLLGSAPVQVLCLLRSCLICVIALARLVQRLQVQLSLVQ